MSCLKDAGFAQRHLDTDIRFLSWHWYIPSYLSELLHLYSPSRSLCFSTDTCMLFNASTAKPMAFALFHTLAPTSGTIFPKTSGTLLFSPPLKANSWQISSRNISVKQHCPSPLSLVSVCAVCVCVCVCVCIVCIVTLERLSALCVSF